MTEQVQQGSGTELAGQAAGVAGDPAGQGVAPPAASSQVPTGQPAIAGQAEPTTAAPVTGPEAIPDLSKNEEFRKWQAARDRRERELERQVTQQQVQLAQLQQTADEARLASASPEEQAEYYAQTVATLRQQQQAQAAQLQERQVIMGKAQSYLQELGIPPDTPGLIWPQEVTYAGLAELMQSAARIKGIQNQATAQQTQQVVDQAAHAARVGALKQAGVTQVNLATGAAAPPNLAAEFAEKKKALLGSDDTLAYMQLKREYKAKGLDL